MTYHLVAEDLRDTVGRFTMTVAVNASRRNNIQNCGGVCGSILSNLGPLLSYPPKATKNVTIIYSNPIKILASYLARFLVIP